MTLDEAKAHNTGIETMRAIARAAAARIEATGTRPLAEGFAVAALRQLDHDAEHLLLPIGGKPDAATSIHPSPAPKAPAGAPATAAS